MKAAPRWWNRLCKGSWAALLFALMFLVSACSSPASTGLGAAQTQGKAEQSQAPGVEQQAQSGTDNPVTLKNNDREITYPKAPTRAVTLNQHVTEVMLALGLGDKMVGTAYLDDQILPEFKEAYDKVPVLSDKYPTKEVLMAAEPDFVYAGWKSGFGDKGVGSMEELEKAGIQSYLHESSNKSGPTVDDVFTDIQNIGRIFRVEDRAIELVGKMKMEMEQTTSKLGTVDKPLKVFVYDSGEEQAYTAASNYMTALIKMAGGKNIFDDIQKGWADVSWEEVVIRNPDVIIIVDYGDKSLDQKRDLLLNKRELENVSAIQNKRLLVLPLSAAAEGVRAPIALKILAEGLYPEKFK
ncbi:MAG: Fe3+-hydroxamate transporter substrate-binding protein [Brevibacillus sp.]|nr:Fe3+-hydroxamate transporter substrate-binding protein [Brevibacillus sp.]